MNVAEERHKRLRRTRRSSLLLLVLCLAGGPVGCDDNATDNPAPQQQPATTTDAAPPTAAALRPKIKFKSDDGKELYSFKYRDDGAKLEADDGTELVRLRMQENDRLKIKDKTDATVGYVGGRSPAWELRDAEDKLVLYTLRKESGGGGGGGGYRLEGSGVAYQFRRVGKTLEVQDAEGAAVYRVRYDPQEKRTSLRNAADQRLLVTREDVEPVAMACMGLDKLSLPQRAALFFKLQEAAGR